jgi:xanthine dehydrogenase small subunit
VLVGRPAGDRLEYRPIDACIAFLHQLDASHVVTVEGLARGGALHPVQRAMIDGYGSQCGFCTPGIVMALAGHFEAGGTSARQALTGNLCRCTGYWQILESAAAVDATAVPRLAELYPETAMLDDLRAAESDAVRVGAPPRELFVPIDLEAAGRFKAEHADCQVVAGATDVAVRRNKGAPEPAAVLALGRRIAGFDAAAIEGDVLRAGAGATWSRLLDLVGAGPGPVGVGGAGPSPVGVGGARVPQLAAILERFGAPQIRNAATIGGNVANASPIADSLPFLYVMGAMLELVGPAGSRRVPIESFYRGYKKLDLGPGELIARLEIPLPQRGQDLRLYKMSRRRALDIATFTAAVLMRRSGDTIVSARLAYGGVGPTVVRLPRAEAFLAGRPFTADTMRRAGEVAIGEITPWTDVRGSELYRRRLAENVLVKFFHDVAGPEPAPFEPFSREPLPVGQHPTAAPAAG